MMMGIAIVLGAIIGGFIRRGPFFGVLLAGAISVPFGVIGETIWRSVLRSGRLRKKWPRRAILTAAGAISATVILILARPPSGERLLQDHLGLNRTEVSEVRAWHDTWGIDPMYGVRFRVEAAALESAATLLEPATQPQLATDGAERVMWHLDSSMPGWWAPPLTKCRLWSQQGGDPWLYLAFDLRTGYAYLIVVYH